MMTAADQHDISLRSRKLVEVTGVSSVESFDVHQFALTTSAGPLQIQGNNLHMKHLDLESGVVVIEGTVNSMTYVPQRSGKRRFAGKILR